MAEINKYSIEMFEESKGNIQGSQDTLTPSIEGINVNNTQINANNTSKLPENDAQDNGSNRQVYTTISAQPSTLTDNVNVPDIPDSSETDNSLFGGMSPLIVSIGSISAVLLVAVAIFMFVSLKKKRVGSSSNSHSRHDSLNGKEMERRNTLFATLQNISENVIESDGSLYTFNSHISSDDNPSLSSQKSSFNIEDYLSSKLSLKSENDSISQFSRQEGFSLKKFLDNDEKNSCLSIDVDLHGDHNDDHEVNDNAITMPKPVYQDSKVYSLDMEIIQEPIMTKEGSSLNYITSPLAIVDTTHPTVEDTNTIPVKHSPQLNIIPKKSILRKNSRDSKRSQLTISTLNRNNSRESSQQSVSRSGSSSAGSRLTNLNINNSFDLKLMAITRNNSSHDSRLNATSPISRKDSQTSTISRDNSQTSSLSRSTNSHGISRLNTLTRNNTSVSSKLNTLNRNDSAQLKNKFPPILTAFHHPLPTPPTPKSTKFNGDYEKYVAMNEDLRVPDVLNEIQDIYSNREARNIASSYCTLTRPKRIDHTIYLNDFDEKSSISDRVSSVGYDADADVDVDVDVDDQSSISIQNEDTLDTIAQAKNNSQLITELPSNLVYKNNYSLNRYSHDEHDNYISCLSIYNQDNRNSFDLHTKENKDFSHTIVHSNTMPRLYGRSNENESNTIKSINLTEKHKYPRPDSLEADILISNIEEDLTCFEQDMLKACLKGEDTKSNANSIFNIFKEEETLLKNPELVTP